MRDLYSNVAVVETIAPAILTADNTPAAIDLAGYGSALLVLHIGAGGVAFDATNKIEFKLTHSDDDSSYAAVTADDLLGLSSVGAGGVVKALTAAHASSDVTLIGYKGGKRYLKLLADFSGTHGTGTPISAVVIKGHPAQFPVNV